MNKRIEKLQQKLNDNMDKAVKLAEDNTTRNEQGHVVITKEDEWRNGSKDNLEKLSK
jgi:tRNA G26 N,N-dimethylase Trm1